MTATFTNIFVSVPDHASALEVHNYCDRFQTHCRSSTIIPNLSLAKLMHLKCIEHTPLTLIHLK